LIKTKSRPTRWRAGVATGLRLSLLNRYCYPVKFICLGGKTAGKSGAPGYAKDIPLGFAATLSAKYKTLYFCQNISKIRI